MLLRWAARQGAPRRAGRLRSHRTPARAAPFAPAHPKPIRHPSRAAGVPIGQGLVPDLPLEVTWTGNTVFDSSALASVPATCRNVGQVYNSMNATLFFQQFIGLIFKPRADLFKV